MIDYTLKDINEKTLYPLDNFVIDEVISFSLNGSYHLHFILKDKFKKYFNISEIYECSLLKNINGHILCNVENIENVRMYIKSSYDIEKIKNIEKSNIEIFEAEDINYFEEGSSIGEFIKINRLYFVATTFKNKKVEAEYKLRY